MPLVDSKKLFDLIQGTVPFDRVVVTVSFVVNKDAPILKRLEKGIYQIGCFSLDIMLWDGNNFDQSYPTIEGLENCCGVCDSLEQFKKDVVPLLEKHPDPLVVSLTHINKKNQPSKDGWRWRKWGPYIGKGTPTAEYLYDEPGFESGVHVFHVYQLKDEEVLKDWGDES